MSTTTQVSTSKTSKKKLERFLLVFVLDRTGSMSSCYDSTISGFNEFLHAQQKEKSGKAYLTLVQFDANAEDPVCQVIYQGEKLSTIADLGSERNPYVPRGGTPLFDAVGQTIISTDQVAKNYDHILFIIQTDGYENASREYNQRQIFDLVGARRKQNWDFIFLGADIDAYATAYDFGVDMGSTLSYDSRHQSLAAFAALSTASSTYRHSSGHSHATISALAGAPVARPKSATYQAFSPKTHQVGERRRQPRGYK